MQHCNMQLASTVWCKNARIVKSLDQTKRKVFIFLNKKKVKQRSIDRSGVRQQTDIEEAAKHMKIQGQCEGPMWWREDSEQKLGRWRKSNGGGALDMVRVDRHGEALIWCRKCSVYARHRLSSGLHG